MERQNETAQPVVVVTVSLALAAAAVDHYLTLLPSWLRTVAAFVWKPIVRRPDTVQQLQRRPASDPSQRKQVVVVVSDFVC